MIPRSKIFSILLVAAVWVFWLATVLLSGCGPLPGQPSRSNLQTHPFTVVVHNRTSKPAKLSISVSTDGYASILTYETIPPGGDHSFQFAGGTPDCIRFHNPGPPYPMFIGVGGTFGIGRYDYLYGVRLNYPAGSTIFDLWYL